MAASRPPSIGVSLFACSASLERDGRRIVDATVGGACTVFEKVDLESVVEERAGSAKLKLKFQIFG